MLHGQPHAHSRWRLLLFPLLVAAMAPIDQSVYYRADAPATEELVGSDARRPLPYPPTAIQCMALQDRRDERHLLLIARHADLYNADWLIHEATGEAEKTDQTLAAIECL